MVVAWAMLGWDMDMAGMDSMSRGDNAVEIGRVVVGLIETVRIVLGLLYVR